MVMVRVRVMVRVGAKVAITVKRQDQRLGVRARQCVAHQHSETHHAAGTAATWMDCRVRVRVSMKATIRK